MSNAKARDAAYSKVIGREYDTFVDNEGEPRIKSRPRTHPLELRESPCSKLSALDLAPFDRDVVAIDDDGLQARVQASNPGGLAYLSHSF